MDTRVRPNWMADASFDHRRLGSLCLPGSHDSGAYRLQPILAPSTAQQVTPAAWAQRLEPMIRVLNWHPAIAAWSQAQKRSVAEQLGDGIRLLDLRICESAGALWIHHGLLGPHLEEILDDLATFIQNHPREVLVVRATKFDVSSHAQVVDAITSRLDTHLFRRSEAEGRSPGELPMARLRGRLLWFYEPDDGNDVGTIDDRFWSSSTALYADHWCPRARDVNALCRCQGAALEHTSDPFHLQWILTPQPLLCGLDALRHSLRLSGRPYSLASLSATLSSERLSRFVEAFSHRHVAAISTDMYERSGHIPLAVDLSRNVPFSHLTT